MKVFRIVGKDDMKVAASVAIENKNNMMRKGGIAPAQWVLGKFPRGVGHLLEEEEWGQLGVIQNMSTHMFDSTTEFGMRARYRLESMKHFQTKDN